MSERQLQVSVVAFLRESYPWVPLIPGLGEHQTTYGRRIDAWQKGYISGVPDLLILAPSGDFCGLAIEFKSPKWKRGASVTQKAFLQQMEAVSRFKTLVSYDYDAIASQIVAYLSQASVSHSSAGRLEPLLERLDRFAYAPESASRTSGNSDGADLTPE